MLEQPTIVLRRVAARQGAPGRGVQHVVDDLGTAKHARVDDLLQGRSLADGGNPEQPDLARGTKGLKRWHDLFQHLARAQAVATAVPGYGVVQVEDVHVIPLQSAQAAVAARDVGGLRARASGIAGQRLDLKRRCGTGTKGA